MPEDDILGAQPRAGRTRDSGGSQGRRARGRGARDGAAGRNGRGIRSRGLRAAEDGGTGDGDGTGLIWPAGAAEEAGAGQGDGVWPAWGAGTGKSGTGQGDGAWPARGVGTGKSGAGHDDDGGLVRGAVPAREDRSDQGDPVERARQICLRMLTAAPRTRAQLADALHRRGIPGEAADAVLGRFTEAGLIDDAAFARAWVESRHHGRGLARRALAAELRRRGVDTEEVRAAVEALSPDDELATARRLVARRAASSRGKPQSARIRQLMGLLARKGYPAGLAYQVVREALEQEGPGSGVPAMEEIAETGTEDEWPPG